MALINGHHDGDGVQCLVRFSQSHETFRVPELEALATLENIPLQVTHYASDSPFCIVTVPTFQDAARLVKRSILTMSIYEYWGTGTTLDDLHNVIKTTTPDRWPLYETSSFKFSVDSFQGSRTQEERIKMINTFSYLDFKGPISMSKPDEQFVVFDHWKPVIPSDPTEQASHPPPKAPYQFRLGRLLGLSSREVISKYDLKKRRYISTTSMDSELALITANLVLAAPGKMVYDPFVGTGSFPVACAHYGAIGWGSDIDGRALRGETGKEWAAIREERLSNLAKKAEPTSDGQPDGLTSNRNSRAPMTNKPKKKRKAKTLLGNFEQYNLTSLFGDVFTSDLTNTPIRRHPFRTAGPAGRRRLFDCLVCDPPYGVREGLRVLGCRDAEAKPWIVEAGVTRYKDPDFIAPKKPYSFLAMLDDLLHFASETLVDEGRLSFWMPTANDEDQELDVPQHPCMELVVVCVQPFNKWSRRLITYRKVSDEQVDPSVLATWHEAAAAARAKDGVTADELNPFRKGYFSKFQTEEQPANIPESNLQNG